MINESILALTSAQSRINSDTPCRLFTFFAERKT